MSARCPYCRRPSENLSSPLLLNPRRRKIYQAVANAGPDGVASHDLITVMYGEKEPPAVAPAILRVTIYETNKALKLLGQRIVSNKLRGYVLVQAA